MAAIIPKKSFGGSNIIKFGELQINTSEKNAFVEGEILDLTKKEYELLLYFISNKNKVISKSAIAEHLWGDDMDIADNSFFRFFYR